jgi:ferric-dicitrate binding protein FerR (iron transport regulator)
MNGSDRDFTELARLIGELCDERIEPAELERLEAMLRDDPAAQRFYHECVALRVDLAWMPIEVGQAAPSAPQRPDGVVPMHRSWQRWVVGSAAVAAVAALAACLLLALGLMGPDTQSAAAAEEARVVALIGEAGLISPAGNMVPLTEGEVVAPGQIVTTGREDSVITLEYPDAMRVTLGTDSLAQLPAAPKKTVKDAQRVFLFRGFLRAELPKTQTAGSLVLASAHAEVAAEGRQVDFWASPESTRVESDEGRLKLTRRADRHVVDVQTGTYLVVSRERAELKPQPLPAATKPRLVLREGTGPLRSIAFSPDGKLLATGGWKGEVKFWNTRTGATTRPALVASKQPIRAIAFGPGGKLLVTGVDEKDRLKLWDLDSRGPARLLKGHRARIHALAFADDGTLVSLAGNPQFAEIKSWDSRAAAFRADLAGHALRVNDGALSKDGQTLATASRDGTVKIWDVRKESVVRTLVPHQGEVFAVALSDDGALLASGGRDGTVAIWDVATGQERRRWQAIPRGIKSLAFSPDGAWLASAGDHPDAKLWDVSTGRELAAFRSLGHATCAVRFSPDGRTLAVADWAATVTLWDVPRRDVVH